MKAVDAVLRGWANYYKYATDAGSVFDRVQYKSWHMLTHWMAEKLKCSRRELVSYRLDGTDPLSMNGVTLTKIAEMSAKRSKSHHRHNHPYLEGKNTGWESLPQEDPWLANDEERRGWEDGRWKALERDDWTCQECGANLEGRAAHVHHDRTYSGYQDSEESNKQENLVSLCKKCHQRVESKREYAHR
jgi:5-methylcytosine-specific restriction endonuclease McrA